MKRPPSALMNVPVRAQILEIVEGMMEYRSQIADIAAGLPTYELSEHPIEDRSELRSALECALVDACDPLLRALLAAAGGPLATLLEAALDLTALRSKLEQMCEGLPHSPQEEAMLDGEAEPDEPMEIRATVQAVIVDQLTPAMENLLRAARYRHPGPSSKVDIK